MTQQNIHFKLIQTFKLDTYTQHLKIKIKILQHKLRKSWSDNKIRRLDKYIMDAFDPEGWALLLNFYYDDIRKVFLE